MLLTAPRRETLADRRAFWNRLKSSPCRFWLDSGEGPCASFSAALAWEPLWIFSGRAGEGVIRHAGRPARRFRFTDPTEALRDLLERSAPPNGPDGFTGGAVGYWGYECNGYFDGRPRRNKARGPGRADGPPDFMWVMPRFWAVFGTDGSRRLLDQAPRSDGRAAEWRDAIHRCGEDRPRPRALPLPDAEKTFWKNQAAYERGVERIKRYIAAGDIYQANLTHRLDFPWPEGAEPADLFDALRQLNPSPYSALMEFGSFSLVTCSPELLLRARGDRLVTRPIAGTRPRGRSAREDEALSGELLLSPKERAEHIMLVDLERNDLGRVCRPGTVRVSEKMALEKYSHVIHIVSQVEGRLAPGRDGLDALRALFPGGTITGCPKIRCVEILETLEREPRGPFFGSAGWIGPSGDMDLNILIRTALIGKGRMTVRVGAGIVADSVPEKEYEESLHKAQALVLAYESVASASDLTHPPSLSRLREKVANGRVRGLTPDK